MTDKHTELGKELIEAMKEVKANVEVQGLLQSRSVRVPETIDIKKLRKKRGLSQKEFAEHYGFSLSSVQDWEQGRRKPERAARILLAIIENDPQIVEKVLNQKIG